MASAPASPTNRVLIPLLDRAPVRPAGAVVRTLSGRTMGTTSSVKLAASDIDIVAVETEIRRELDLVVAQMSPWEPDSFVSRFNRAEAGSWLDAPVEFTAVTRAALAVAEQTDGAFDPTLGELTNLWGFGPTPFGGTPPSIAAVEVALGTAGWRRVRLEDNRIFQPGGLALDLCGIAKGFAVDQVALAIERLGVSCYLVEVGGELRGAGVKPDGQPWWVELEAPPQPASAPKTLIALHGLSVATSGGYRRFFDHDGRRFTHTLNPVEGSPVHEQIVSASVLHRDCMVADALATIKALSPLTPVLLLTGWGQGLLAEADMPAHVDVLLSKPPKLSEIREALAQHCHGEEA